MPCVQELQQKLMNSESSVERLQGLQRTSAGEISFLRARLDFHMTATATVAKWNAAKLSQAGESDATTGVSASESAMIEQKLTTATPELPPAAEMASLQKCLDDSRAQVDKLETSKKVPVPSNSMFRHTLNKQHVFVVFLLVYRSAWMSAWLYLSVCDMQKHCRRWMINLQLLKWPGRKLTCVWSRRGRLWSSSSLHWSCRSSQHRPKLHPSEQMQTRPLSE